MHSAVDKFMEFLYLHGKVVIPLIFLSTLLRRSVYDIEGRRLGIRKQIELLSRVLPISLPERTITWNYIEPIQVMTVGTGQLMPALAGASAGTGGIVPQVQLNVSHTKLADLHPADIADILEQLDVDEAGAVLGLLGTGTAAH